MTTDDTPVAPDSASALNLVDGLLAEAQAWDEASLHALARALPRLPGRHPAVARRLRELPISPALAILLDLSPQVAGAVEGAHHLFGRGVARRFDGSRQAKLSLSLELWPTRARHAQSLRERAAHVFGSSLVALEVGGHRVLRGTVVQGDSRLSKVGGDLEWLTTTALRLRKTVVWLDGWRFDANSLHGPSVAVHYVRRVLERMRRSP